MLAYRRGVWVSILAQERNSNDSLAYFYMITYCNEMNFPVWAGS